MRNDKEEHIKYKHFKISALTGEKFIAACDLMGIEKNQVIEELVIDFVNNAQSSIASIADVNPLFASKYPFVDHPD